MRNKKPAWGELVKVIVVCGAAGVGAVAIGYWSLGWGLIAMIVFVEIADSILSPH